MKKICLLLSVCFVFLRSGSQMALTSGDIYLGLKKLNVLGSVLYVAAHPDDENTRLITYFSKDKLYRTGYLSMTRGDGGQNLIGDEQGVELGLIRTQELLAARRIDGGEQFFTRAFDFGYSKNPEETFAKWDREKILSDVVWVIRRFQPDVIVTRFPTTGEGGHGHHTASAILANEAFVAAADPKRFPEQLQYVKPWQAKRILWNSFNFNNAEPPAHAFRLDVGSYHPILGKSYGEIAAESRSQHKSQGFGSSGNRGEVYEYFTTTGGAAPEKDLFDGVSTGWDRIGASPISGMVDRLIASYDFLHPEKSVKGLVDLYKTINALPEHPWKTQKLGEVVRLIEACSGLFIDATTSVPFAAQTDSVRISFVVNNRLGADAALRNIRIDAFDTTLNLQLAKNRNHQFSKTLLIAASKPVTQPYWLVNEMKEGRYEVNDQLLIGLPDVHPAYTVQFSFRIAGADLVMEKPVRHRFNDPVRGEVYQPFVVVPVFTIETPKQVNVLLPGKNWSQAVSYTAHRQLDSLKIYQDQQLIIREKNIRRNETRDYSSTFDVALRPGKDQTVSTSLSFRYFSSPGQPAKTMHTIQYDHIPSIRYFKDAENRFLLLDVKTAGKRIGYIAGAGDKVPAALEQMGYEVSMLSDLELSRNNLQQFDAIITGVRAYNTNDWLNKHYEKLMKYVEQGGNLIVQYNTSNNIGPVRAKIGPYQFNIVRNRITDENSPVSFLQPEHPVLNFPNKITVDDFEGWVQERSIYHARPDSSFQAILRMNDPGEPGDDGSLIIARYGKGYFTYTGLVFFRQLPAGVPGAYRLMANLIALNSKKEG